MALNITARADLESRKLRIEPQLVLEIDGVATLFGAVEISRVVHIGDPGLTIGNAWKIGGVIPVANQADVISMEGGGTRIDQQLQPDKGSVSSVSSIQVNLVDRNLIATRLISPGVVVDDILGRKAVLWVGFKNTSFKDDYVPIISGIIDDISSGPGNVMLNIAHPEQLKRQDLFLPVVVELAADLHPSFTTITVVDTSALPLPALGPDGVTYDPAIKFYVRIEDEIIRYTGVSGNTITGCTRAELGTAEATHLLGDNPVNGTSLVQIADTVIDCALKVMLSGVNGPYKTGVTISRFLHPTPFTTVANSVFFDRVNLNRDYGVVAGDYVDIEGSTVGANNVTRKVIQSVTVIEDGSYIVIEGVTVAEESDTTATISFRSQYDTLGYGLALTPDQVDIEEHIFWQDFQLASMSYRFVLTEKINGKEWLDKEVYLPVGAYSLPRQGRCSMGYTVGAVIRDSLAVISRTNIKNPDQIKLRRTIGRNFYNIISYQFEKVPLTGKYSEGAIAYSADSQTRIPVGNRALSIQASGMRRDLDGEAAANRIAARYLARYRYGAEFFESINLLFRDGYAIEPGDVVLFDATGLQISNTVDGTRNKPPKLYTVINKSLDLKTGDVKIALTDANFDNTERFGMVAPSSLIVSGTTTDLIIEDSFGAIFPGNESLKWSQFIGQAIRVVSPDWVTEERVTLKGIDPANKYRLILEPTTPLSSPPSAGFTVEIDDYPDTTAPEDDAVYKAIFGFASRAVTITDGADDTHFEVGGGDIAKFVLGSQVRVFSPDYANDTIDIELTIIGIVGNVVEVSVSMGFTPLAGYTAENMDFKDGGHIYRIF